MNALNMKLLLALIADDAYAISFQTMGQYRTALLKAAAQVNVAAQEQTVLLETSPDAKADTPAAATPNSKTA
jgi:hypothetical protein